MLNKQSFENIGENVTELKSEIILLNHRNIKEIQIEGAGNKVEI
jgi:hypothetical protein